MKRNRMSDIQANLCDWNRGTESRCRIENPSVRVVGHGFTYAYCDPHAREVANRQLARNDTSWKYNGETVYEFLGAKKKKGWREYR